jgi:hypothetical protein
VLGCNGSTLRRHGVVANQTGAVLPQLTTLNVVKLRNLGNGTGFTDFSVGGPEIAPASILRRGKLEKPNAMDHGLHPK